MGQVRKTKAGDDGDPQGGPLGRGNTKAREAAARAKQLLKDLKEARNAIVREQNQRDEEDQGCGCGF